MTRDLDLTLLTLMGKMTKVAMGKAILKARLKAINELMTILTPVSPLLTACGTGSG